MPALWSLCPPSAPTQRQPGGGPSPWSLRRIPRSSPMTLQHLSGSLWKTLWKVWLAYLLLSGKVENGGVCCARALEKRHEAQPSTQQARAAVAWMTGTVCEYPHGHYQGKCQCHQSSQREELTSCSFRNPTTLWLGGLLPAPLSSPSSPSRFYWCLYPGSWHPLLPTGPQMCCCICFCAGVRESIAHAVWHCFIMTDVFILW